MIYTYYDSHLKKKKYKCLILLRILQKILFRETAFNFAQKEIAPLADR